MARGAEAPVQHTGAEAESTEQGREVNMPVLQLEAAGRGGKQKKQSH